MPASDRFALSRVRAGEWMIGAGSLVLLVTTFALPWYGLRAVFVRTFMQLGANDTVNGWNTLFVARWFIVATALLGLVAWTAQATRRAPALPVVLTVAVVPLSLISCLFLIHRVILSEPGPASLISVRPGAVIALVSAITIFAGTYVSLRQDGIRDEDGPGEIETVRLGTGSPGTAQPGPPRSA